MSMESTFFAECLLVAGYAEEGWFISWTVTPELAELTVGLPWKNHVQIPQNN